MATKLEELNFKYKLKLELAKTQIFNCLKQLKAALPLLLTNHKAFKDYICKKFNIKIDKASKSLGKISISNS